MMQAHYVGGCSRGQARCRSRPIRGAKSTGPKEEGRQTISGLSQGKASPQSASVFRVREIGLPALLSFWMVGCQSPPLTRIPIGLGGTPPETVLSNTAVTASSEMPLAPTVVPNPMEIAAPTPLPSAPEPSGGTAPAVWLTNRINAWVAIQDWGPVNGYGRPLPVANSRGAAFELRGTNGVVRLRLGSRIAQCDGYEFWLGFAPQLIRGLPHVHLLDAVKNLRPLIGMTVAPSVPSRSIVIDPGHGGRDVGTRSVFDGTYEKEYTLDWALRLGRLLTAKGWTVHLTRTNDAFVSLSDRVGSAEKTQAALFLSLHFNSGLPNKELAGLETYCMTPAGVPSSLVRNFEDDPRQVYPNNTFDDQNLQFALGLHRALLQAAGAPDRGVRRARFMGVLRAQNRPAVLIEAGYLTNPGEARKIASPAYRQTLAEALARWLD
jgi:N-acetylmuramoyl-L-alanine amidase